MRGITWLNSAMVSIHQLRKANDSTQVALRIGASNMGFITSLDKSDTSNIAGLADSKDAEDNYQFDVEPGLVTMLPPGTDFKAFGAVYPQATAEPFTKGIKHDISNALGVSYHTLYGDLNDVNFSSGRLGNENEKDLFKSLHTWFSESFCEPLYLAWIQNALSVGALTNGASPSLPLSKIDKFTSNFIFKGRTWGTYDPVNDVNYYKIRKALGTISGQQLADIFGNDYEQTIHELATERDLICKLDIQVDGVNDPMKIKEIKAMGEVSAANTAASVAANASKTVASKAAQDELVRTMRDELRTVAHKVDMVRSIPSQGDVNVHPSDVNVAAPQITVNMATRKTMKTEIVRDERGMPVSMNTVVEETNDEPVEQVIEAQPEVVIDTVIEPIAQTNEQVIEQVIEELKANPEIL